MKKYFLWLAMASISLAAWATEPTVSAEEPNTMYIYHTNGTSYSASLDEEIILHFLEDNLQITVLEQDPLLWPIDDVAKITFGIGTTDETPTAVETLVPNLSNDVRKVFYNGQLIIIKNGVKYSVLGTRI